MAVLKYKNPDTGQWETIPHIVQGSSGDGYELTDEDKNEIAGLVEAVSYSQTQTLTPEQKETARVNIGVFSQDTVAQMINGSFEEAVPKSLVVDNLVVNGTPQWDKIPNGNALQTFIETNSVSSAKLQKNLTPTKKGRARTNIGAVSYLAPTNVQYDMPLTSEEMAQARTNIGAISQTELDQAVSNIVKGNETWQTIADITLTEPVKDIIVTQDTEGQAFSLTKAKVIVDTHNQDEFYTATANISLGILSAETGSNSRSIYLTNYIPNTADKYSRAIFEVEVVDGMAFVSGRCKNSMKTMGYQDTGDPATMSGNLACTIKDGIISYLNINTNSDNGFAVDTRVQVLGVRA